MAESSRISAMLWPGGSFWKTNLKLGGWIPTAGSALAVAAGMVLTAQNSGRPEARVVEIIIPLVLGWQAALLLSPELEPALELLLSYPQSVGQALYDRLAVVSALAGGVALLGNLVAVLTGADVLVQAILRWLGPAVFLAGAGTFTTQMTRQGALGAAMVTLVWGGMLFGGDAMLARWPFLWPVHLYLQPQSTTTLIYAVNRLALIIGGVVLTLLASSLTHNEERMLGIQGGRR